MAHFGNSPSVVPERLRLGVDAWGRPRSGALGAPVYDDGKDYGPPEGFTPDTPSPGVQVNRDDGVPKWLTETLSVSRDTAKEVFSARTASAQARAAAAIEARARLGQNRAINATKRGEDAKQRTTVYLIAGAVGLVAIIGMFAMSKSKE